MRGRFFSFFRINDLKNQHKKSKNEFLLKCGKKITIVV